MMGQGMGLPHYRRPDKATADSFLSDLLQLLRNTAKVRSTSQARLNLAAANFRTTAALVPLP